MRKVLLVEDDELISRCVTARLRCADYEVHSAFDGLQGIKLVRELRPDVVLLDIRLPVVDGMTALKSLKSDPATAHFPVIMLSASISSENEAIEAGAHYFVRKPFASKVLLDALNASISDCTATMQHRLHISPNCESTNS